MMVAKKDPRKKLPQCLADFNEVVNSNLTTCTSEVLRLSESIRDILISDTPRESLNRHFCRLREANPGLFSSVHGWLLSKCVLKVFSEIGMHSSRLRLLDALGKVAEGVKPHAAFGMDENNGPPALWGFTLVENAAIYAQSLELNKGMDPIKARTEASIEFSVPTKDIALARIPKLTAAEALFWGDYAYNKINLQNNR